MRHRLKKLHRLFMATLVSSFFLTGQPFAQQIEEADPISIMDQPPYGFHDKQGNSTGYLYDIGEAILRKANLNKDVNLLPMKRLFKYLEEGTVDCTLLAATPFTRSHYRLIEPTGLTLNPGIIPKAGIDLLRYEDLIGLTIAVPRGVSFDDRFDQDKSLIKVTTNDYRGSVLMLESGRVDAIVGVWGSYLFNAQELGLEPDKIFGTPLIFNKIPIWLVCRHGGPSKQIEDKLKLATSELRTNGVILKIAERYLGTILVN